jgi:hypothetical protein
MGKVGLESKVEPEGEVELESRWFLDSLCMGGSKVHVCSPNLV